MDDLISRQAAIDAVFAWYEDYKTHGINVKKPLADWLKDLPSAQLERKKDEWTTHEVACLLAEVMGDDCACNVNGNDEWLPYVCDFGETACPNVVGATCWEQWLVHRKEKADAH